MNAGKRNQRNLRLASRPGEPTRLGLFMTAAIVATAGFLAVVIFFTSWAALAIDDLGEAAAAFLAAFACWSRGRREQGRLSRGWLLLAGSAFSWCLGELVWSYYELVVGGEVPFPSAADAGFLMAVPLAVGAILAFFTPPVGWTSRLRVIVDALIVVSAAFFVSWFLVLGELVHASSGSWAEEAVSLAYPATDVLIISVILLVGARSGNRDRVPLGWISLGLLALAIADTAFAYLTLKGVGSGNNVLDTGWFAGYLIIALAACRHPAGERSSRELTALPYIPVGVAAVLTLARFVTGGNLGGFLLVDLGVLIVFVVVRQILTLAENHVLTDGLEATVQIRTLELHHSEGKLRSLVSNISDVVSIVGDDGTIRYISPSVRAVFGYQQVDLVEHSMSEIVHDDDRDVVAAFLAGSTRPGRTLETRIRHADGSWRYADTVGTDMRDDPALAGFVLTTRDVTERRELEAELLHQTFHEPLTGLANRTLLHDRIGHALGRIQRTGLDLAVAFFDLDDFKSVNDTLGHAVGDALLVQVATRLVNVVRPGDTVARMGGDEFAILMEETDEQPALAIAERIGVAIATPFDIDGTEIRVTASIGVALSSADTALPDDLLRDADVAMYRAKTTGKARCQLFRIDMREAVADRAQLITELRRALELGQLELHYQPLIELDSGRLTGFEALCRWTHPTLGAIGPEVFIPLAEESGLIVPLGDWVLNTALAQLAIWDQRAPRDQPLTMSINVSIRQLDAGFNDRIAVLLASAGVDPTRITLEMTESVLAEDSEVMIERLSKLKKLGVRLAIDDFGTGFSSMSYLSRLPIDSIKIDKSFVDDLGTVRGTELVRTLIELGNVLGLDTVAEGVEQPLQSASLLDIGCRLGQGYLFSKPLAREAAEALLVDVAPQGSPPGALAILNPSLGEGSR
jgi:diguanylate cyclase (GGDEF)-like protein/PAS domain S-box-containing protein